MLTYVTFVLSLPVPCGQTARALEIENEVLGADPCGGRVCEEKCSCGKSAYFNLENIIQTNIYAKQVYTDICITDAASAVTPTNNPRGFNRNTQKLDADTGFVFQQLQTSLVACGFTAFRSQNGFGKLYKYNQEQCNQKWGRGGSSTRRVAYPPNILVSFAIKLKDFSKVCQKEANWKQNLISNLNKKLEETKKENSIDLSKANACLLSQAEVMKNNFAKLIMEGTEKVHREYCSCKKLSTGKVERRYGRTTRTEYPFKMYESTYKNECARVCSGALVLEYDE
jgi:hypothetical protein